MKNTILIALITSLLAMSCKEQVNHELLISQVNIINVESGEILPNRTVGIDSNRITKIYETAVSASDSTTTLDGKNGYLIPGLWDMHAHINWNEKESSQLLLANGVTGIREMWSELYYIKTFRKKNKEGYYAPDIYTAGRMIDGKPATWPGAAEVTTAEEARAEVLNQIEERVDFLKVYSKLNQEAFDAIAETAKENRITFAGHVPMNVDIFHAAEKGMASAEHMYGILRGASTIKDSLAVSKNVEEHQFIESFSESLFDSLCQVMVSNDMWLCPTLIANKASTEYGQLEALEARYADLMGYINPFVKKAWDDYLQSADSVKAAKELLNYNFLTPLVGKAHEKGVKILAGTDFPISYVFPGFSMHEELQLLVESGMSDLAALQAATSAAAEFMKKTDDFGTVEEGKVASLVLLQKNPLEDISNTQSIEAVIQRGQLYDREALDEMLLGLKAELALATTTYSELFKQLNSEIGFEAALDSVTVLITSNEPYYYLNEDDMSTVLGDFYMAGDMEKVLQYVERLTIWFPESSIVHGWAGQVLMMMEQPETAIAYYEKALTLNPENEEAKAALEQLQ